MTYQPFHIHGPDRPARWLVTCDHASNCVPDAINGGDLGLAPRDMTRHIAYDVGAAGVTRALADLLNGPAITSNFSRLVIDPNRGEEDPTLLMRLCDGTIIPANRHADTAERERRLDMCHRPYHNALGDLAARRDDTVLIAMHSFTPRYKGRPPRPWHIGVLYPPNDPAFSCALIKRLQQEPDLCVGDNEPYIGYLPGDAVNRHATTHNRPNALIEIRNDLIETDAQQSAWAKRLAPILEQVLTETNL